MEQFLNRGLRMGHFTSLRDIFKACGPRLRGCSAPVPAPEAASSAPPTTFARPTALVGTRFQLAPLGQPAANRQFLIPFPTAVG